MILNNLTSLGLKRRKVYQRRLPSDNSKDYYYVLRNSNNDESIIVEYGFIDNKNDLDYILNNYEEVAEAVIKAILEYKGLKYIEPSKYITDKYIVVKGDSLYSIAKKLDTTVEELKKINNLDSNLINVGDVLNIPSQVAYIGDLELYQVKKGDNLYEIANKYNITLNELKSINNLDSNNISEGMIIKVPSGLNYNNIYIVSKGDSLYSIAKKLNINIDKLKEINNLDSNLINIGQKLIIPNKDNIYTVKKGDTLYSISKKYNISIEDLKKINNLNNNILNIGQILIVNKD